MKNLCFFLLFICCPFINIAQQVTFDWAHTFGNSADDYGISTVADAEGNVYTLGTFVGTTDFDNGPGVAVAYTGGFFITKHDKNGNLLWVKSVNNAAPSGVALDKDGNIYYGGVFSGTPDFDPGARIVTISSPLNAQSAFVSKLDANGNFLWAKAIDNASVASVALDTLGNLYATGSFAAVADFDPGAGIFNLTESSYNGLNTEQQDIFVLKLDAKGDFVWAKQMGGISSDEGNAISLDPAGNIVLTGTFRGTADFDPGAAAFNLTSSGLRDIFAVKINNNGDFLWAKSFGGPSEDYDKCITTDKVGNIYLAGFFYEMVDFDPGPGVFNLNASFTATDVFISKLDTNGNFIWAKQMGGKGDDVCIGMCLDNLGNIYTTGSFSGIADFDPGTGVFNLIANGFQDVFISKLGQDGNFIWAKSYGSVENQDVGSSIFVDASNNIYTTGWFWGTVDFDPEAGIYNLQTNGIADIFIQKLTQCPITYDTLHITVCSTYTLNDQVYSRSGTYMQSRTNSVGCDSVIILQLLMLGSNDTTYITACDHYTWRNHTYSSSGIYTDSFKGVFSCDSILNLNLTINKKSVSTINASICEGSNYSAHSLTGTYIDTLVATNGCDSIRTLLLTVLKKSKTVIAATICEGDNYSGYTKSGSYTDTLIGANGCDSVRSLNLLVNLKKNTEKNVEICDGQSYIAAGSYRTISGVFIDSLHTTFGCDSIVTTNLKVNPKPAPELGGDRNLCEGQIITVTPAMYKSYCWQDGSTRANFTISKTGKYWVKVTDKNNCMASDSLNIVGIFSLPSGFLKARDSICNYEKLTIGSIVDYPNYFWSTGSDVRNITIQTPGVYTLMVTDNNGCNGSESITVYSKNCIFGMYVPNAFTPNGDGRNDSFKPLLFGNIKSYFFAIYNIFGQLVFQGSEPGKGWDGNFKQEPQNGDVFVWICKYQFEGEQMVVKRGVFTLLK